MAVTVVIPCFNEAGTIGELLAEMPATIVGHGVRVLVVDDGSTDSSAEQVARFATEETAGSPEVQLLSVHENRGKGAALRVAMDHLRGKDFDALVWMDSDGQHRAASLEELVRPVVEGRVDLCVGSRYLGRSRGNKAPLNRRVVRAAAKYSVQRITGFSVSDPFSGLRCFSRSAAAALKLDGDGYEAELEACFSAARAGLTYHEVAIPRIYGPATSKMGYRHGALRGRVVVVAGYIRTIFGQRREVPSVQLVRVHG